VPVAAHWSVLGVVALIAVIMARVELPLLAPGHGVVAYAVAGTAVALLLMVSLLAHEAAHALVARAHGLGVEGITLWLLGGATRLRDEPDRPAAELRIAVVGPAVSALLAALFALAAGGAAWASADLVVAVLVELAVINLLLAAFNILPAAPLDGGRVLRAVLWRRRGDRWGAGIVAARAGQGFGALLAGGGLFLGLTVDLGGFWLAILGWFIAAAAGAERRRAELARALEGVPVVAVARPAPMVLGADTTPDALCAAATTEPARAAGLLLTGPDGGPTGYLPPSRLRAAAARADDPKILRRLEVPSSRLTPVRPHDAISPLLGRLAEPGGHLLVLDGDVPVGVVSAAEVERLVDGAGRLAPPSTGPGGVPAPDSPPPPGWWWHGGPSSGAAVPPPPP
jgi:Zn-dependent protease